MFSLRQITVAGFLGVYPGCLLLAHNFARLPYWRGAAIGVAFGALMQVVMMLLYLLCFAVTSDILGAPSLQTGSAKLAVALEILAIQTLSAVGCRIMGSFFLYPKQDVATFDRDVLMDRIQRFNSGKRSVVNDLDQAFKKYPPPHVTRKSWMHILLLTLLTFASIAAWTFDIIAAFNNLWFDGQSMDFNWGSSLFINMFVPFAIILGAGYVWLWYSFKASFKHIPKK